MLQVELRKKLGAGKPTLETCAEMDACGALRTVADTAENVLIVDNEETSRELAAAILAYQGYRVHTAANSLEALTTLRRQRVDLLIAGLEMPLLGGRWLAGRARRIRPHLPVLFMAGRAATTDAERHVRGGQCAVLHRPFSFVGLVELVEDLLTHSTVCARFPRAVG
jgi:DNA-binding NtrC family response regulator